MKRVKALDGFTLLEMLTALAIIALLIALLLPALSMIQKSALNVKQKSQFHTIEIALEAFSADVGDYPSSSYTIRPTAANPTGTPPPTENTGYCGAQKLAEAIIGMDGFGYSPQSQWRSDRLIDTNGDSDGDTPIYFGRTAVPRLEDQAADIREANLKARKGPYLELEKANAVKLSSLYPAGHDIYNVLAGETYVFCDMFNQVKNLGTGKKTGMPILYFKANTSNILLSPSVLGNFPWPASTTNDAVYNVNENFAFIDYFPPWGNFQNPMVDRTVFYNRIKNPNFTNPLRPYRAQSFLLLSAGVDGLYGTPDDVYNIDEGDK